MVQIPKDIWISAQCTNYLSAWWLYFLFPVTPAALMYQLYARLSYYTSSDN